MSLLGKAAVAIWQDPPPEARAEYFEWHNREHMLERAGIPGFLRGRRYCAINGQPEFFTLYEAESLDETAMEVAQKGDLSSEEAVEVWELLSNLADQVLLAIAEAFDEAATPVRA